VNGIEDLKKRLGEVTATTSAKELEEMQTQLEELVEKTSIPEYLGIGVGLAFSLFILSCLMSIVWNMGWNFELMDKYLPITFGGATLLFLVVGIVTVNDIYSSLKQEYQEQKAFVNNLKKTTNRKLYV